MKRNILRVLLLCCILFSIVPTLGTASAAEENIIASGTCGENLTWVLDNEGTLTISGTGDMDSWNGSDATAPWNAYTEQISSVIVEAGVTSVGDYAFFACTNLTTLDVPNSITSIGEGAFYVCASLEQITIPGGVTSIEAYTFARCISLTQITIPNSIISIGEYALARCTSLSEISIPDSVAAISPSALYGCSGLIEIHVDTNNPNFSSDGHGVLFDKEQTTLLRASCALSGSYCIPESVTSIGNSAFNGCTDLIEIIIPDSVISIDSSAFSGCTNLTELLIPDSVTSIGDYAFYWCTSLPEIVIPDGVSSIGKGAFWGCSSLTEMTIPPKITAIADDVFCSCTGLTEITIPRGITSIGDSAFYDCPNLTDVYYGGSEEEWSKIAIDEYNSYLTDATIHFNSALPVASGTCGENLTWTLDSNGILTISGTGAMADYFYYEAPWSDYYDAIRSVVVEEGVTTIGKYAFWNCSNLISVDISNSVTSIGYSAFSHCTSLISVTIPEGVTSIDDLVFDYCSSLTGIHVAENNPSYSSDEYGVLFNKGKTKLIRAPEGISGRYQIPEDVTDISLCAFFGCSGLTSIVIPEGVTSIGNFAFYACSGLTSVNIPGGVTRIGDNTFSHCSSLTNIVIPDGVISIDEYTFFGCTSLSSIEIPESVTGISSWAFSDCTSLNDVYYGGSEEQWNTITIYSGNDELTNATIHFNSTLPESKPSDTPFTDVPSGEYYYAPVLWAVDNGVTAGVTETTFVPDGTCTRAQIVTFLWRAKGCPEPISSDNPFTDVAYTDYYYKPVLWAMEKGITMGTSESTFSPEDGCTRSQVATFLWRAEGEPSASGENIFSDLTSGAYYYDAVLWAVDNGITNGMGNGTFAPDETCTRAQIVTFLYRALNP